MMKLCVIATLVAVLAFGVGSASAQDIGIFADLGSASCNIAALPSTATNFYINVIGSAGITGTEVKVQHNLDIAGLSIFITPFANPLSSVSLGDIFGPEGGNIAFSGCQVGPSINLYRIQTLSLSPTANNDQLLSIVAKTPPSNVNFDCPLINLCDDPQFTAVCVAGGAAWMNSTNDCTVAVEEKTWGEVKNLFN